MSFIIYMHLNGIIFSFPYFDNHVYLLKKASRGAVWHRSANC